MGLEGTVADCRFDEEIKNAIESGAEILIELDFNAKLGKSIIPGDIHDMSRNGKYLWELIQRNNLVVINGTEKCPVDTTTKSNTSLEILLFFLSREVISKLFPL